MVWVGVKVGSHMSKGLIRVHKSSPRSINRGHRSSYTDICVPYVYVFEIYMCNILHGLPRWCSVGNAASGRCKRCNLGFWVEKIPWNRKWQPAQYYCLKNSMDRGVCFKKQTNKNLAAKAERWTGCSHWISLPWNIETCWLNGWRATEHHDLSGKKAYQFNIYHPHYMGTMPWAGPAHRGLRAKQTASLLHAATFPL